jgi:ABC-type lipoprotein release transport system permease subunit
MAWRNVWRNWRRTVIAGIAIALGLTLILFFDGMLNGMDEALYGNTVRLQGGNVQVHAPGFREKANSLPLLPISDGDLMVEAALDQENVIAAAQRIRTGGMVSTREGTLSVAITGIDPEREEMVSMVAENIVQGRWLKGADEDVILIGNSLAESLDVRIGDRVTLVGRATHQQMRQRTMTVIGVYDIGMSQIEKGMVYISLQEAQSLFDLRDQSTEIAVYLEQVGQEPQTVRLISALLPGYEVDAWDTLDPTLKEYMEMEDQIMTVFGVVILLIAGVGILNLMLMAVFERTREIGLLAAMGLKRWETMLLFLLEGIMIGMVGALVGCLLAGGLGIYLGRVGLNWAAIYGGTDLSEFGDMFGLMGDRLYIRISLGILLERALTVGIISALASLYPAWQASKREPADALHYV